MSDPSTLEESIATIRNQSQTISEIIHQWHSEIESDSGDTSNPSQQLTSVNMVSLAIDPLKYLCICQTSMVNIKTYKTS